MNAKKYLSHDIQFFEMYLYRWKKNKHNQLYLFMKIFS